MTILPDAATERGARCLIPAAGRGSRMRPITATVPKELLPVGTRPILQWCLTEVLEGGFREIAVVICEGKPSLEEYLLEGRWREGILPAVGPAAEGIQIELFRQAQPLG
ncbi:MAG TPA: sugar phosphate nucleotidyltransferase, partial [Thermoanaerobaculia bacterium]|nr:sugar phosphate nucleotidyltransferase [Thermoanaerobaculia bacterium]